ncbi:MAG: hypothetical protein M3Y58_03760 [Chloroflexota bacterium]|nr:hypothetical protein [Chloroflexota bacterium]
MTTAEEREARELTRAIDARLAGHPVPQRRPKDLDRVVTLLAAGTEAARAPSRPRTSGVHGRHRRRVRLVAPLVCVMLALIALPVVAQKGIIIHRAGNVAVYEATFPTAPPTIALPAAKSDTTSLAQAQQHVTFAIPSPSWLPQGYELASVRVIQSNPLYETVSVLYRKKAASANGDAFQILYNHSIGAGTTCYQVKEGTRICDRYSHPVPQGSAVANITINGQPALLIDDTANDARSVEFERDDVSIAVAGPASLPADAFIRIAASLRSQASSVLPAARSPSPIGEGFPSMER